MLPMLPPPISTRSTSAFIQHALCAESSAIIKAHYCFFQGASCRFEDRFNGVVVVVAVLQIQMQGGAQSIDESFVEFAKQIGIKIADAKVAELRVPGQVAPAAKIDGNAGQGAVHGITKASRSLNSGKTPQCFENALAQNDARVFNQM